CRRDARAVTGQSVLAAVRSRTGRYPGKRSRRVRVETIRGNVGAFEGSQGENHVFYGKAVFFLLPPYAVAIRERKSAQPCRSLGMLMFLPFVVDFMPVSHLVVTARKVARSVGRGLAVAALG